jgi:hypothetical protein
MNHLVSGIEGNHLPKKETAKDPCISGPEVRARESLNVRSLDIEESIQFGGN